MLYVDAVLFEDFLIESGVKVNEAAGHRTGRHVNADRRFPGFSEIGIGMGQGWCKKNAHTEDTHKPALYRATYFVSRYPSAEPIHDFNLN